MNKDQRVIQMRMRVLEHAKKIGNVRATCHYFGVSKSSFYRWKSGYDKAGEAGLANKPCIAKSHPSQISQEVVDRVL